MALSSPPLTEEQIRRRITLITHLVKGHFTNVYCQTQTPLGLGGRNHETGKARRSKLTASIWADQLITLIAVDEKTASNAIACTARIEQDKLVSAILRHGHDDELVPSDVSFIEAKGEELAKDLLCTWDNAE